MPEFISRPRESQLAGLIAQMQARRSDPIAQGILQAGQAIGGGIAQRGQNIREDAATAARTAAANKARAEGGIMGLLGKGGTFSQGDQPAALDTLLPGIVPPGMTYSAPRERGAIKITPEIHANYPEMRGYPIGETVTTDVFNALKKKADDDNLSPSEINMFAKHLKVKPEELVGMRRDMVKALLPQTFKEGQAEVKAGAISEKEKIAKEGAIEQAYSQIEKVDQALKNVSGWSTGWGAATFGKIPGSQAKDLQGALDTIKANLGFATLAEMKRASPSGGALGAISESEMKLLTSARESLDKEQSQEQLRKNLEAVKTHYTNWVNTVNASKEMGEAGAITGDLKSRAAAVLAARKAQKNAKP